MLLFLISNGEKFFLTLCVCVCVCETERKRENQRWTILARITKKKYSIYILYITSKFSPQNFKYKERYIWTNCIIRRKFVDD